MQLNLFGAEKEQARIASCVPVKRFIIRALNLYAGIGGNRDRWRDVAVTAVEKDQNIARIYQIRYPQDTVIVGDAHEYLLQHYKEFDFIWSSPPCPTHSQIRRAGVQSGKYPAMYPDIKLWEEVTLLKYFAKCKWVVENVKSYYTPIIEPTFMLDRHYFWSNFDVPGRDFTQREVKHVDISGSDKIYGFDLSRYNIRDKRRLLRNMVNPEVGAHILKYV